MAMDVGAVMYYMASLSCYLEHKDCFEDVIFYEDLQSDPRLN